ncbi:HAD superfamily hydrolase (TIGR01459 family) [Afipia massiliensis]|uniref:HAD superfamily hydrolase (TIGR01459 family) n=1 Tax=Afipia massiliensis TaxID=211460 RepID=A0A840N2Z0_9BRAD|nr:TIGR01459 family HAD-type hydrolase [Afipia massiliensis]MBB5054453.1 HAD superfamily hydrolase (TIGR01459 family) [Afipia massiliensis]
MKLPDVTALRFADRLRDLTSGVDVILSDVWGVIHDGVHGFPDACKALQTFRAQGGTVIMITNAPRPADSVQRQLRKMEISDETYDAIVSSGDLTRSFVASRLEQPLLQIGPERDNPMFRGLDVKFTTLENAEYIVCTGPYDDEVETEENYRGMMEEALKRNLTFVCANPDMVVERGHRLITCAGAIAELYRSLGGEVIFYGKPHRPIYDRALELAAEKRGGTTPANRILAIGDSVRTDLTGANLMGLDCLFLTRGIHAVDFEGLDVADEFSVRRLFGDAKPPLALMRDLKW